jgi:hypothetical protein
VAGPAVRTCRAPCHRDSDLASDLVRRLTLFGPVRSGVADDDRDSLEACTESRLNCALDAVAFSIGPQEALRARERAAVTAICAAAVPLSPRDDDGLRFAKFTAQGINVFGDLDCCRHK